jgi:hypothetical protein
MGHLRAELGGDGGVAAVVVAALAAGVAELAGMSEAVGSLVQWGAEHVDRAALQAFAADQHLGPVAGLVGLVSCQGPTVK